MPLSTDEVQGLLETYHAQGYVILEGLLGPAQIESARNRLADYLEVETRGRNNFEGTKTQRVYSLVGRGKVFENTVTQPEVLQLLDELLMTGYLLTASQAIVVHPGETPQPIHFDDTFYLLPRPRPAVSVSTIWALDDFTLDNGATQVIPGSHQWSTEECENVYMGDDDMATDPELEKKMQSVVMPVGSCVLFAGTLLHRGGANRSGAPRRAFSHQYCEPWARQQENFFLSIPAARTARMSDRLQELLGYSIHPPFMGQVAGRHPKKTLDPRWVNSLDLDDQVIAQRRDDFGMSDD